jgi:hypothetical protein
MTPEGEKNADISVAYLAGNKRIGSMNESKPPTSKPAGAGKQGGLNAEIQSRIGHQLRAMYDDVVKQGVPDRFAELIRQLDAPGTKTAETAGSGAIPKNDGRD